MTGDRRKYLQIFFVSGEKHAQEDIKNNIIIRQIIQILKRKYL